MTAVQIALLGVSFGASLLFGLLVIGPRKARGEMPWSVVAISCLAFGLVMGGLNYVVTVAL